MKIRIGFGLGTRSKVSDPETLGGLAQGLERLGFDSLWFSERVSGTGLDPIVAMSWIAARTEKLKFGPSVMVLPGRNPVLVAKSIASLDRISDGRVLPAFGLGAVNLGDIGKHFPDTDPKYKAIDSKILLSSVMQIIREKGYKLGNVDSTICLQKPKIQDYIPQMQKTLASCMGVDIDIVSIKATTTEELSFVGREEGVSAYATVLITSD